MNASDLLGRITETFSVHTRPTIFTNANHCCECAEHNRTLSALHPDSLRSHDLGNPGWDPICFATPEAFLYFFPGLARLAASGQGQEFFFDRFVFHLSNRIDLLSPQERSVVAAFLWQLYDDFQDSPDLGEFAVYDLDGCLRQLEQSLPRSPEHPRKP